MKIQKIEAPAEPWVKITEIPWTVLSTILVCPAEPRILQERNFYCQEDQ